MPSYLEAVFNPIKATLNQLPIRHKLLYNIQVSDNMILQGHTVGALITVLALEAGAIMVETSSGRRHDKNCIPSMFNDMFNQNTNFTHMRL